MQPVRLKILCCTFAALSCTSSLRASASEPWDGRWAFQDEQSPGIISISSAQDGTWAYSDDGVLARHFVLDGKVHRFGSWAAEYRATLPDPHTLLLSEGEHGYDYEWWKFVLSPDGKQLTVTTQRQSFSGAKHQQTEAYTRSGGGAGFAGSWKPVPPPPEPPNQPMQASKSPAASPQPSYVIWTDADGVISWYYPSTGELDRGKCDGLVRPILGPLNDGESFSYKAVTSNSFEFTAYDENLPALRSLQEISPDGQTLTETYWKPGHEGTKIVLRFHRLP